MANPGYPMRVHGLRPGVSLLFASGGFYSEFNSKDRFAPHRQRKRNIGITDVVLDRLR